MRLPVWAVAAGCVLSAGLLRPMTAAAQEGGFELTPFAGAYVPTRTAVAVTGVAGTPPQTITYRIKQRTAPVFGVRLAAVMNERVAIEGEFGYATSGVRTAPSGATLDGHVALLNARVVYRGVPGGAGLGWHVLVGGGLVDAGGPAWAAYPHTMHLGGMFGGGFRWVFPAQSGMALRVDLTDNVYMSDNIYRVSGTVAGQAAPKRLQNDLLLTAGLAVRWGGD